MEKITLKKLASGGLYLSGPNDQLPEGFMRRYRGVSAFSKDSVISRDGSTQIHALDAHSLKYFNAVWHSGVSTSFYVATTETVTGLSGNRLSFAAMAPTAGIADYLFVAGGGTLFKIDGSGNNTTWGIAPPANSPTIADGGAGGSLTDGAVYKYALTYLNSATGTRSNSFSIGATAITANFKILLHLDGSHLSTTITNAISGGMAFTANGTAQLSLYEKVFGSTSLFGGNTGYLSAADSADVYLSGDFTIFAFFLPSAIASAAIFQQRDDDDNISFLRATTDGSGAYTIQFLVRSGAAEIVNLSYTTSSAGIPPLGYFGSTYSNFSLLTVTRSGNDWYLILNGVVVDSDNNANAYPNLTGNFEIGRVTYGGSTIYLNNYLDEFCLVNGTALWSGGFDPPDAPFGSNQVDLAGGSTSIDLTAIPQSSDAQVDIIELWRTIGNGDIYFKLIGLTDGTTTYTDNIADSALLSTQLPTDNLQPYSWFDDCYGPWNGSMFWITRTQSAERGRVYYSPIGRAEAVQGFIEVTSDDDGLQKLLSYAGNLFVLSKSRAFQIYGTNPYYVREVPGVPGTTAPQTVAISPIGPIWESQDGVRIFLGGAQGKLIAYDQVKPIFRGRNIENINAFTGTVATFARGEYIISNGTATLALNIESLRWRDLGIGCGALAYSPASDQVAATLSSKIVDLEKEGDTTDNAVNISLDILTPTINLDVPLAVEMVRFDANANTETLAANIYYDDSAVSLGNLTATAGRRWSEFDAGARMANRIAIRLNGSIDAAIEVNAIEITYWPMVLVLRVGDSIRKVPGRLSGDRQTLTFEDFSFDQDSLQSSYVFDLFHYDVHTASNNVIPTLTLIGESAITLSTINTAARTVSEQAIAKKGRFQKLALAGDFTAAIAIRRLELVGRPVTMTIRGN